MMERQSLHRRLKSKEEELRANYAAREAPRLGKEERMAKARAQVKREQDARVEKEEEAARVRAAKIRDLTDQVSQLRRLRSDQNENENEAVMDKVGQGHEKQEQEAEAEASHTSTLLLGGGVVVLGALLCSRFYFCK